MGQSVERLRYLFLVMTIEKHDEFVLIHQHLYDESEIRHKDLPYEVIFL